MPSLPISSGVPSIHTSSSVSTVRSTSRALSPRPARPGFLCRLGAFGQRLRCDPSRRSRSQPLRPRPVRPRRRALNPERRVPQPLGNPQRPPSQQGGEAVQPSCGRRAGAQLQPDRARRRPRSNDRRLHGRARLEVRGSLQLARQLGGDGRGTRSGGACPGGGARLRPINDQFEPARDAPASASASIALSGSPRSAHARQVSPRSGLSHS
jgi:hypothetical protein